MKLNQNPLNSRNPSERTIVSFFLVLLLICTTPVQTLASQTEDLFKIDIETLMNIEIISVSKRTQKAADALLPVIVIDEEEIRLSGASNIPDLLRRVAGVGVLSISASDHNVSIRGFNQDVSRTILVMIDGRSVYIDFYGMVLWDTFPVTMEEIKRIELVKGPGSSIYGGDAFNGVINIITKSPGDIDGMIVSASGGEYDTFIGSVIYGKKEGEQGYKIAFSRDEQDEWEDRSSDKYSTSGNFAIEKETHDNSKVILSGSIDKSEGESMTTLDNFIRDTTLSHLMLKVEGHNDLKIKLFWNGLESTITGEKVLPTFNQFSTRVFKRHQFDIDTDTYDMEMTKLLKTEKAGTLLMGGNFRYNSIDSNLLEGHHNQSIYGLFVEDEIKIGKKTKALFGGRYDHHPLVKGNFSPRLGLVRTLKENHHARLSYTTAYGLPTFTYSYLRLERNLGLVPIVGDKDLDDEKIQSWNMGYSGLFRDKVEIQADLFHNRITDFIRFMEDPLTPGADIAYSNRDSYKVWGGELSIKIQTTDNLDLLLNYAHLDIDYSNRDDRFGEHPRSKANVGINYSSEKLFGSIFAHYVSKTRWPTYVKSLSATAYEFHEVVDDYTIVNANIGYHLSRSLELSLRADNLFDHLHSEHSLGDTLGRKIIGKALYRF